MMSSVGKRFIVFVVLSLALHGVIVGIIAWIESIHHHETPVTIDISVASPVPVVAPASLEKKSLHPVHHAVSAPKPVVQEVSTNPTNKSAEPAPAPQEQEEAGGASSVGNPSELSAYVGQIALLLNKNKIYPREALEQEQEGRVTVEVHIAADGTIEDSFIKEPSPFDSLNKAALSTIKKVGQLKFRELRDKAHAKLGDKFNIREFHDQVLSHGALPMGVLEKSVNEWMDAKAAAVSTTKKAM